MQISKFNNSFIIVIDLNIFDIMIIVILYTIFIIIPILTFVSIFI